MGLGRRNDRGLGGTRVGDVADNRDTPDFGGDAFRKRAVEVAHGNPGAQRCKPARGCGAQSRCATGDDGGLILQLHGFPPLAKLLFVS